MSGMTLIELMVALAIGAFLMIGAVTVFMQSRTTFRLNDSLARLQENGRFALDVLEPDIRMAHYFGLTTYEDKISNRAGPAQAAGIGPAYCGNNWTIDFENSIGGTNNRYTWTCPAFGAVEANADTIVVRRVSEDPVAALQAGRLYLQSARQMPSELFVGTAIPAAFTPATSQTFQVIAHGYYVSRNSAVDTPGNPVPSLRRQTSSGGVTSNDEILPGVEDMQIQFGVDTDPEGDVNRGTVNRYVNPEDPIITPGNAAYIAWAEIVAVRVWLLIRSERVENGYTDTNMYTYGDRVYTPNDGFRRALVSKTIYLRNARKP
jgi:prepilin-type N-terminal cleavage/methylation domain-containing protein